jgi:hypothetical protein
LPFPFVLLENPVTIQPYPWALLSAGVSGENVGGMDAAAERTWTYPQWFSEEIPADSDLC